MKGYQLKKIRKYLGYTQKDLYQLTGITVNWLSAMEKSKNKNIPDYYHQVLKQHIDLEAVLKEIKHLQSLPKKERYFEYSVRKSA